MRAAEGGAQLRTLPREGNLRRIVIGQGFGVGSHESSLL